MAISGIKKVFATPLDDVATVTEGAKEELGTIRFEGNAIYKYIVYNDGAGSVDGELGGVTFYYAVGGVNTEGYNDNEVTSDETDGVIGAGVSMSLLLDGQFGWIQIRGFATLTTTPTGSPADGDALTAVGTSDHTLDACETVDDAQVAIVFDAGADTIICNFPF